ncbi:MAG: S1 RNA-binding domain-containing protein [Planctomycetes bacterium]|nr:S1 RNA-binding domain-containing protein [Planctomycetota bacterium]
MSQTDPNQNDAKATNPSQDEQLDREVADALEGKSVEELMNDAPAPPAAGDASAGDAESPAEPPRIEMELKRGRITAIRDDDVFVDLTGIDAKHQGVVPLTQFERPPRLGSIMDFVVERIDEKEGVVHLSREGAVTRGTWDTLTRGAIIEARCTGTNKGGLELEMVGGIRAFMPASQADLHHIDNLETFVGQKLHAIVHEIDRKGRKVIISRRAFLEKDRAAKRIKLMAELEVGQTREGKVSSVVEYGCFVDLGGVDGLVHVSDLSYTHVNKPADVVKVGQDVTVKVLKIDKEKDRISLGLKQVAPDPWGGVGERLKPGSQVSGRVLRTADFGVFIEVEPGIEGLLPASEMSWKRHAKPSDLVKPDEVLRLAVLAVDPAKRRLTLSLKQSQGDPWVGASHTFARNTVVEATVLSTTEFGAFMELTPGVEGLVHISELADRRVNTVEDVVKPGEKHQVRVLEVDEDNRRIRLSIKAVKEPLPEAAPAAKASDDKKPAAAPAKAGKPKANPNLKGGIAHASLGTGLGQLKL